MRGGESCRRRPGASSRGPDCSLYTFPLFPISWLLAPVEPVWNPQGSRIPPGSARGGAHVLDGPAAAPTPSWAGGRAGKRRTHGRALCGGFGAPSAPA